jgi:hypothetical protein
MNRFAPPRSDVVSVATAYELGKAGWLSAFVVSAYLLVIVVGYPRIVELFSTNPGSVFFVYFASLTGLLLVLGLLLLLARLPSSMLLFAAALLSALLEFHNDFREYDWPSSRRLRKWLHRSAGLRRRQETFSSALRLLTAADHVEC